MSATNSAEMPISKELLDILRCPQAVQEKEKYGDDPGRLELVHNSWLVSHDSGLKYPIRDGIPVMLIDEGEKWKHTAVADLPVPPPASDPAPQSSPPPNIATSETTNDSSGFKPQQLLIVAGVLLALLVLLGRGK